MNRETNHRNKRLRRLGIVAFFVLNAVVLFFTARSDFSKKPPKISFDLFNARNATLLAYATICLVIGFMAETLKYLLMMKKLGQRVSLRVAFETFALGKYYDSITPSGAGGQPFQIHNMIREGYTAGTQTAMPLAAYMTAQFGFVLLALFVFIFNPGSADIVGIRIAAYFGLAVYATIPLLVAISPITPEFSRRLVSLLVRLAGKLRLVRDVDAAIEKTDRAVRQYSDSLRRIAGNPLLLITMLALSLVYRIAICSIPYFVVRIFGEGLGFLQSLTMCVYVGASATLVPTPGNAGAAEGSFYLLFDQLDTTGLFWAMLLWRFFSYYMYILVGVVIYAFRWKRGKPSGADNPDLTQGR